MKLIIDKNQIDSTPELFLRHAGYGYIRDRQRGVESFVRRLGSGFYPRFHVYTEIREDKVFFNLHLDQKQASYEGSHMHNAEHNGEAVENEITRLKSLIAQKAEQAVDEKKEREGELLNKVGGDRDYKNIKKDEKKKSWWRRLFV